MLKMVWSTHRGDGCASQGRGSDAAGMATNVCSPRVGGVEEMEVHGLHWWVIHKKPPRKHRHSMCQLRPGPYLPHPSMLVPGHPAVLGVGRRLLAGRPAGTPGGTPLLRADGRSCRRRAGAAACPRQRRPHGRGSGPPRTEGRRPVKAVGRVPSHRLVCRPSHLLCRPTPAGQ